MKRILILSANPNNTDQLRLDEEVREIQAAVEHSKNRDQFEIKTRWAVRVDDLQPILLDITPQIVHFSGHGGGSQGLALENEMGLSQMVNSTALAGLFKLFKANLECVFLNACYSQEQAKAIYQHINCVIGINQAIGDRSAIKFAKGFYRALASDKSYKEAFDFGCNAIDLQSIPESSTPVLKLKKRLPFTQIKSNQTQGDEETKLEQTIPVLHRKNSQEVAEKSSKTVISQQSSSVIGLNPQQQQRILQELKSLEQQYELLTEKWNYLRLDLAKQAGGAVKFQLQQEIRQIEVEREQVGQRIKKLENSLE